MRCRSSNAGSISRTTTDSARSARPLRRTVGDLPAGFLRVTARRRRGRPPTQRPTRPGRTRKLQSPRPGSPWHRCRWQPGSARAQCHASGLEFVQLLKATHTHDACHWAAPPCNKHVVPLFGTPDKASHPQLRSLGDRQDPCVRSISTAHDGHCTGIYADRYGLPESKCSGLPTRSRPACPNRRPPHAPVRPRRPAGRRNPPPRAHPGSLPPPPPWPVRRTRPRTPGRTGPSTRT